MGGHLPKEWSRGIQNLQDTCMKLVVYGRARARDLKVDLQVAWANKTIVDRFHKGRQLKLS